MPLEIMVDTQKKKNEITLRKMDEFQTTIEEIPELFKQFRYST
jgi:hypothetical protein